MQDPSAIPQCLSFTVRGHWGHFRRIEGNSVKNTYRVMPRTTVAGMLGAIVGAERNSYYDVFVEEESAIAIELSPLRTINLPVLSLSTDHLKSFSRKRKGLKMSDPDSTADRQRDNYEVLVEPAYRIHVWVADDAFYEELKERLEHGTSVYTPTLGLSEYIASIEYHGTSAVEPSDETEVSSAVPGGLTGITPSSDAQIRTERSSGFMEADNPEAGSFSNRTTTGFIDWAFTTDGSDIGTTGNVKVATVTPEERDGDDIESRHVVFT